MALAKLLGARVKRSEDPRFLLGKATYTDDVRLPGTLHMAIVRSTQAHARIRSIDVAAARGARGVVGVYTGKDVHGVLKPLGKPYNPKVFPPSIYHQTKWLVLAHDKVRYVGEAAVAIVAESRYLAEDAAELVEIDYEELPAFNDADEARKPGAALLHEEYDSNVMLHVGGASGDVDGAFAEASVVVRERFRTNRHTGVAMECRAVLATCDAEGELTLWSSHQTPHMLRTRVADCLGYPEQKIRVIVPDVGGGFGPKAYVYPEEVLVCHLARLLQSPVRWTEDRREHLHATGHAKEQIIDCEMAFTADGTLLGIRAGIVSDLGAYSGDPWAGPFEGLQLAVALPGPYKMKGYAYDLSSVWTNKMAAVAYRGVGLTPAVYVQEHMMDIAARKLGIDPVELRLKNMIRPEEFPYVTLTGLHYDSSSSTDALQKAVEKIGYQDFRKRQAEARSRGKYLGIGFSTYIEMTTFGTKFMNAAGIEHHWNEAVHIRMDPNGGVTLAVGTLSHGQGHQTVFAQVAADELGVRVEDVKLLQGDTHSAPYGGGTGGSRSAVAGSGAIVHAAQKIREKMFRIAGKVLEVSPEDLELGDGAIHVKGVPTRSIPVKEIARMCVLDVARLPEGEEAGLEAGHLYEPPTPYANATHVAEVEVDVDTGQTKILRYLVIEDCGKMINPMIVEGQISGGVAQGIGTALYEHLVYDEIGQLQTGTFMDYLVPTATDVPDVEFGHMETLSPLSVKGIKGMGEGGAIAPPGALANAIADALSPFGAKFTELPITPQRVWDVIRKSRAPSA